MVHKTSNQWEYLAVAETVLQAESGQQFTTYGIEVRERVGAECKIICFIRDIFDNLERAEELTKLFTARQLDPVHLMDVIEDMAL